MKSIHDPRYIEFIEKLTSERRAREVTQEQLSTLLGRPQSYVAKVENLDRRVDIVETRDWLIALGIAPSEFMTRISWWTAHAQPVSG